MFNIKEAMEWLIENGWDPAFVSGLDMKCLEICYRTALGKEN